MKRLVVAGATLRCSMGTSPGTLSVAPGRQSIDESAAIAIVADFAPMVNVPTFGMCRSPANPQVASATAAAQGVLTPMPCTPVTTAPWSPGASVTTVDALPALTADSTCSCAWGGTVTVEAPGSQVEVE